MTPRELKWDLHDSSALIRWLCICFVSSASTSSPDFCTKEKRTARTSRGGGHAKGNGVTAGGYQGNVGDWRALLSRQPISARSARRARRASVFDVARIFRNFAWKRLNDTSCIPYTMRTYAVQARMSIGAVERSFRPENALFRFGISRCRLLEKCSDPRKRRFSIAQHSC